MFADFGTVDKGNIVAEAVMQAVKETQNRKPERKSQRIEDFGEKIGGARKDLYAAYCDLIRVAVETEIEGVPVVEIVSCAELQKNFGERRRKLEG